MAERWEILNSASPTETRSTARLRAPLRVTKKENLFRRNGAKPSQVASKTPQRPTPLSFCV